MDNEELYRKHQELLLFLKESEKDLKKYHKKIDLYKKNLFQFIVKLTYSYYPETLPESENKIREEIQFHYIHLIENLDEPLSGFEVKTEHLVNYPITHTHLENEIEELNNEYKKYGFSINDADYLEEIEDIKWQITNEKYRDEIIYQSRKLLLDQFPEIENFSSNAFLQIEYSTKRFAGELIVGINFIICNDLV